MRRPVSRLGKVGMRKGLFTIVMAACLCAPLNTLGHAQETPPAKAQPAPAAQQPAQPAGQPAAKATADTARSGAAEARYRAWVDREHTQDSVEFQKGKAKIEDKYKGYVRPKREKKATKAEQAPDKGN
jgi:hypothetical protein